MYITIIYRILSVKSHFIDFATAPLNSNEYSIIFFTIWFHNLIHLYTKVHYNITLLKYTIIFYIKLCELLLQVPFASA